MSTHDRSSPHSKPVGDLPLAGVVPAGENKEKILSQVRSRYSASLANDTKWNELIAYFRSITGWHPSYRSKWVTGHISGWDTEWFYHLPFPFVGVVWFDIALHQYLPGEEHPIDHSPHILKKLREIGFDFETRGDVVRIWGYFPKSYEDFPPNGG